jgi:TRAP transporter TAXI family solute receptor
MAYTPGILAAMSAGTAMFQKVKGAPELSKNVRAIVNFPLGVYHYVVYESSGIKSFDDLKGKKVFLGPPGGIAPRMSSAVIEAISGLKANEDYTLMRFDWTSGRTAFSDRQMDLTGIPTGAPSPLIQEYAAAEPIRFLGIPDDKLEDPGIKKVLSSPGRTLDKLDPSVYGDGIVNKEPVNTIANWTGLAANKDVPEQVVYDMLKAYWDNIADVHATAAWMKDTLTRENALKEVNIPLHAGAYRYYVENGWNVPDGLKPPEAK